jgi:uncharacterized protein (DUF983 family)
MTPEKAIEILKANEEAKIIAVYLSCKRAAISALEKQTPLKVLKSACPSCHRIFLFRHGEKRKGNYCDNCGQALDWSDTE